VLIADETIKEGETKKCGCTVCNFIHEGDDAPDKCPRYGAPKERFQQIPEDKAGLTDRSRRSNELQIYLATLLEEITQVATKGVNDNLDPGRHRGSRQQGKIGLGLAEPFEKRLSSVKTPREPNPVPLPTS
jgi:rubredoxin